MANVSEFGLPEGKKVTPIYQGDQWAETPIFSVGLDKDKENEFLKKWEVGATLAGKFCGLRRTKQEAESKRREYAIFETLNGKKFRLYTPKQLHGTLEAREIGDVLAMTYNGKKHVEALSTDVHDFTVGTVE